ncbi:MAG TPA: hypothetical protein VKS20_15820 [Candidatus Acidoferrales bacterium]|nr:hypothetical protein [Candidatus Acidoferrales bacterium]
MALITAVRPHWYASIDWPEWALVAVGIVTAAVIGWQSWETRRAANGLVASERAWIEGEITEQSTIGVKRYTLTVRNKGKTPAHIFRYRVWHGPTRDNAKLSKRSFKTFYEDVSVFVGGNEIRKLRDDFDMDAIFSQEASQIANAEGIPQGAFCVSITYGIVIKGRKRRKHCTSFAYRYDLTFSTIRRDSDYDEYT